MLTSTNEKPELELQNQGSRFIKLQYKENSFQPGARYGQDITSYPRQIKKTSFNICPLDFSGQQTDNIVEELIMNKIYNILSSMKYCCVHLQLMLRYQIISRVTLPKNQNMVRALQEIEDYSTTI